MICAFLILCSTPAFVDYQADAFNAYHEKPDRCFYYSEANPVIPTTKMKIRSENSYYAIVGSTWLEARFDLTLPNQYDIHFYVQDTDGRLIGPDGRKYNVAGGAGGVYGGDPKGHDFVVSFVNTPDGFLAIDCNNVH